MSAKRIGQLQRGTPDGIIAGAEGSIRYERMRRGIIAVCETLRVSTREYDAIATEEKILDFLHAENGILRILYSEINIQLMNMTLEERGVFSTNVEKLLISVLDDDKHEVDVVKIVFKIYDHTQLVMNQIRNVDEMLSPRLDEAKVVMRNEMKGLEREYITILGIFAAIMLAFVGTYTFSTSVLSNIGRASSVSLFAIASLIGIVFYKIISLLLSFLYDINGKEYPISVRGKYKLKYAIFFMLGVGIGILLCLKTEYLYKLFVSFFVKHT